MNKFLVTLYFVALSTVAFGQLGGARQGQRRPTTTSSDEISYLNPKEYVIGAITVSGAQNLDKDILIQISKLTPGDRIEVPGDATANAVKNLWGQGLFDDVKLNVSQVKADTIFFEIAVTERARLTRIDILGVKKGQKEDILEKLNDKKGKIVNEALLSNSTAIIKKYFNEKGYLYADVTFNQKKDPNEANNVILEIKVDKHSKTKISDIKFTGNDAFSTKKLKKFLKKTKERSYVNIFRSGKFLQDKYEEDKRTLVAKMQDKGYRDAEIVSDTVIRNNNETVKIAIKLYEGPKYYFGDIKFAGNAVYNTEYLMGLLGIKKGDVFSEEKLEKKLRGSQEGTDVSSVYLNNGYLTFNVDPVQTRIRKDTVDLELRIFEGPQYTINKVSLKGNDITHDRVVQREIRTKPGQKFSKEAVVRTTREIAQLGNFDEQKTDVRPIPNPADGTVDIEYTVAEKPSDQIELSGGFGGGRIIGTLGLTFNNFSARNLFNLKEWKPLPKGDGQKLSIRGQTNGKFYQSYSFSFSEPWLGGKQPVYFGISAFTSVQSNQYGNIDEDKVSRIRMNGVTLSLGKRLKFPDDYFQSNTAANFQQYKLKNYEVGFNFNNGTAYNFNISQQFSRNSVDAPVYPTTGSHLRLTVQATPPYSLLNGTNYVAGQSNQVRKFVEYHKWKFESQWYQRIVGKMVLKAQAQFGFIGMYNRAVGQTVFERFRLGGDGMQGYNFIQSSEIIGLRGYQNNSVIPVTAANMSLAQNTGSPIFNKYIMELRYPLTLSQQAQVFGLVFAEGGNTWDKFKDFSPFNVRRSVGIGARIFLPIFGLLGIDYGYGFDKIPNLPDANKGQFHFSIAQQLNGGF